MLAGTSGAVEASPPPNLANDESSASALDSGQVVGINFVCPLRKSAGFSFSSLIHDPILLGTESPGHHSLFFWLSRSASETAALRRDAMSSEELQVAGNGAAHRLDMNDSVDNRHHLRKSWFDGECDPIIRHDGMC